MTRTIHVYGDSHAHFCFSGLASRFTTALDFVYRSHHMYSTTMHRVGRDKHIINCDSASIDKTNDVIIILYGEIDCRCHIGRQVQAGRDLEEIVDTLVCKYIDTIRNYGFKTVIVVAVPPPVPIKEFEARNGPITHHLPMVGGDEERLVYTKMTNDKLKEKCFEGDLHFVDPFNSYLRPDGMMDFSKSDGNSHIGNNEDVLDYIIKLISELG